MSRWAEAFRASVRSRDTADSVDTATGDQPPTRPATPPPCVNSVSSVASCDRQENVARPSKSGELSTVSAVSRPTETPKADVARREQFVVSERMTGSLRAELQRPPSWADSTALPSRGCFCSCCKGQRWWCEREAPKGWRCCTCHPPDHLPAEAVMEIRT
jgi:hypothetical protein